MKLDVPFYTNTNDGNQCMQVSMQGVLDYFLKKKMDVNELDRLTGRKVGYWTYTTQIVGALWDLGLNVKCYSSDPLEPYLHDVTTLKKYIKKTYPNQAKIVFKFSDFPVTIAFSKKLAKYHLFEQRILSFSEIEKHLKQGHIPILLIDHSVLRKSKVGYRGHSVIVTGFTKDSVTYHESGPKDPTPHCRVSKKLFIRAWNAPGTGNDTIIVYGKREKSN